MFGKGIGRETFFYIKSIQKVRPGIFLLMGLSLVLSLALRLMTTQFPKIILERVQIQEDLGIILLELLVLIVCIILVSYGENYAGSALFWNSRPVRFYFLRQMNRRRMTMDYETLMKPSSQRMLDVARMAVSGDSASAQNYAATLTEFVAAIFSFVTFGLILAVVNPVISLLVIIVATADYILMRYVREKEKADRKRASAVTRALEYLCRVAEEPAYGKDIRMYSMAEWIGKRFFVCLGQRGIWYRRSARRSLRQLWAEAVILALRDGIGYACLIALFTQGKVTVGEFVLYIGVISQLSASVMGLAKYYNRLAEQSVQLEELRMFLNIPEPQRGVRPMPMGENFTLELKNVSFRYTADGPWVLRNISMVIHSGEKLALIGSNGAGKSTLIQLICGFLHPSEGSIMLNGIEITDYDPHAYQAFFSAVFQQVRFLPATVAENVSCNGLKDTNIEKVWDCLAYAGLDDKIKTLPGQIGALLVPEVNQNAVALSGGEAQKLALARALYHDGAFFLLDEPTAALDPAAESEIYLCYHEMTAGKAAIFVSHRLASTQFCDRILVLDNAAIAEEGTHQELMRREGVYARMYEAQCCHYQEGADTIWSI